MKREEIMENVIAMGLEENVLYIDGVNTVIEIYRKEDGEGKLRRYAIKYGRTFLVLTYEKIMHGQYLGIDDFNKDGELVYKYKCYAHGGVASTVNHYNGKYRGLIPLLIYVGLLNEYLFPEEVMEEDVEELVATEEIKEGWSEFFTELKRYIGWMNAIESVEEDIESEETRDDERNNE